MGQRQVYRVPENGTGQELIADSGPGLFMLRVIVVGSTAAAFFGLTGAVAGSIMYGTASLPFLLASSFGFVLGSFRWYHSSTSQALLCLDAYPRLMQLHLDANYPSKRFRQWPAERMKLRTFQNSWILKSMLVVAWLTAQPALDVR